MVLPVLSEKDYTLTRSSEAGKATYTLKDHTYGVYEIVADAPEGWYATGTTGDCTWVKEGSVLTISGTDAVGGYGKNKMGDYDSSSNPAPWKGSNITKVIIEDGVTSVGNYAFNGCTKLESVEIADTVGSIGYSAFADCTKLTSVNIPDSIWSWSIHSNTFSGCNSLKNIVIPNSIHQIESYAFANTGLTSATLPKNVTQIQRGAFINCDDLKSVTILNPDADFDEYVGNQYRQAIMGYCDGNKVSDFTVYGYGGSTAETYAKNYGFTFIKIASKTDSTSGINIVLPESYNISVNELTGQAMTTAAINLPRGYKAKKAYDVRITKTIYVVSTDNPAQVVVDKPGYSMQIMIPGNSSSRVYRKEADGTYTDMNAYYDNNSSSDCYGNLVFYADYTGIFVLTEPVEITLGDVDGNGEIESIDVTLIQRYLAGISIPYIKAELMSGDVDGSGDLELTDVTAIQYYLADLKTPYKIGKQIV